MVIAQRGTAAITTSGTDQFPVDRWGAVNSVGTVTVQQSSTAPAGFSNSVVATVTATGSYSTSGYTALFQRIEGYNVADCAFGTASAKQMTLSFWVRASVTGNYSVSFGNNAGNRWLYRNFTVNAANTWEYKTVQFVGDTSGTWTTDNTTGLSVSFQLGRGTSTDGTENTWSSSTIVSSAGNVDFAANSGATFYLTGVQLEQNYQPTPFEQRPYGVELALCQRYYWRSKANSVYGQVATGSFTSTTNASIVVQPSVPLRTGPNTSGVEYSNMAAGNNYNAPYAITAVAINHSSTTAWGFDCTITGATQHTPAFLQANNNSAGYIAVSVEL